MQRIERAAGVADIRPARPVDVVSMQRIERAAGELFREIGMPEIADDPVPTAETLGEYQRVGRSWVIVSEGDLSVGYVLVKVVDGAAHIEQVSIDPGMARRGLGRRLIEHVGAWSARENLAAVTLTTFRDVPWNGPYYRRLGFVEFAPDECGPELVKLMAEEAEHGLDPVSRMAMRRPNQLHR